MLQEIHISRKKKKETRCAHTFLYIKFYLNFPKIKIRFTLFKKIEINLTPIERVETIQATDNYHTQEKERKLHENCLSVPNEFDI